jgi:hypothetical protein
MSSKQTDGSGGKKSIPNDWLPASTVVGRRKSSKPSGEELEAEFQKMLDEGIIDGISPKRNLSDKNESCTGTTDNIRQKGKNGTYG